MYTHLTTLSRITDSRGCPERDTQDSLITFVTVLNTLMDFTGGKGTEKTHTEKTRDRDKNDKF